MATPSPVPIFEGTAFQSSVYVGICVENILYGVALLLYCRILNDLLTNRAVRKKSDFFYVLFSTIMVCMVTTWIANEAFFGEHMWLLESDYPGGPNAYWQNNISVWYEDWATAAIAVLQLMTDALMIYRCRIIWHSYRVIILPMILWLVALALGILVTWSTSVPGSDFLTGIASLLSLVYCVVAVFLNTTLTCMICYRIVRHGRKVQEHLGREYASLYFSVVTIIVESVLPYTISGIAFLVSLGTGSPTAITFLGVYVPMMCISTQMLILRVIKGRAFDKETFNPPDSTVKYASAAMQRSQQLGGDNRAREHVHTSSAYLTDGPVKV